LKRYFFEEKGKIETFREMYNYVFKSVVSATDLTDPTVHLDVIKGLMIDTHGTNEIGYNLLHNVARQIYKHFDLEPRWHDMGENRRYAKHGVTKDDFDNLEFDSFFLPTRESIRDMFSTYKADYMSFYR